MKRTRSQISADKFQAIRDEACRQHGVTAAQFNSPQRSRSVVSARHAAITMAYRDLGALQTDIADAYGVDRSTVWFAIQKDQKRMGWGRSGQA